MLDLVAYYESQDGGGAYHYVAAVADPHLTTEDDDVRVPRNYPNIQYAAVLSLATTLTAARLESPSLARVVYEQLNPLVNDDSFGDPPQIIGCPDQVIPLLGDESLRLAINSDNDGAAAEYGLVWFSDGPQSEAKGSIYTVRATAAITLSAGAWVNGDLTFDQTLPVGEYDVVGMRAVGANLVAARLFFNSQGNRPGVPALPAIDDLDNPMFRNGKSGIFGRFNSITPPTMDALGHTDTSQEVYLDLIKVS